MCLTAGQTSDHIGAKILYPCLPDDSQAVLIADRGYDSDEYRAALEAKGITPCIPPRKKRKAPATYCKTQYKQRGLNGSLHEVKKSCLSDPAALAHIRFSQSPYDPA